MESHEPRSGCIINRSSDMKPRHDSQSFSAMSRKRYTLGNLYVEVLHGMVESGKKLDLEEALSHLKDKLGI